MPSQLLARESVNLNQGLDSSCRTTRHHDLIHGLYYPGASYWAVVAWVLE